MSMAHVALKNEHKKYEKLDYMIRAKLYKGLNQGTQHITSIYDDEKYKLNHVQCAYCGKTGKLTLDHLISRKNGGSDSSDNLVYACRECNSSKNDTDLIVWCYSNNRFPPILVLRRYLKLAYESFWENDYLELPYEKFSLCCNIFHLDLLPYEFPLPQNLIL